MRRTRLLPTLLATALAVAGLSVTAAPARAAADDPACTDATKQLIKPAVGPDGVWTLVYTQMPGAPTGLDCTLSYGAHNWSVVVLQIALNDCFFKKADALKVDGIYGTDTRNVVTLLQHLAGIAADGVYGPDTADAMRWGYRYSSSKPKPMPDFCFYH